MTIVLDEGRPLLLGSASPRRRDILASLGVPFVVRPAACDESELPGEKPRAYLARVVADKRDAAAAIWAGSHERDRASRAPALLVADTTVVLDGAMLAKPTGEADARAMLRALSGRAHEVLTRFAVAKLPLRAARAPGVPRPREHAETVRTKVEFRALTRDEIARYAASGEGLDKAGAYAVQGLGAFAVRKVTGSYANVVGLPACEVVEALRALGLVRAFPCVELGAPRARSTAGS